MTVRSTKIFSSKMNTDQQLPHDLAHRLRLMGVLERITQISLANENMGDVLRVVLDFVLEVFNADRAWFLYPCDPDVPFWGVPMERTRPEWTGLAALGDKIAMNSDLSEIFSELLRVNGTIQYGPHTDHPIPHSIAEHFSVKSQLMIALRPKTGNSWLFGLHHCVSEVMHDEENMHLFTAIAQRISDFLSSLILIEQLRESEERWKFALEGAGDGVWDWNPQTDEALFSKQWVEMVGYAEHEFPDTGTAWVEHLHPDDKDRVLSAIHEYFAGKPFYLVEFRMRCKDGSWKWILARGKLVSRDADGNPLRMIGTHTDITERKAAEETIKNLAFYDPLTGLPNRRLLMDRLQQAFASSARSGREGALLFIDLDNVKSLNDTLGHDIGDLLLQQTAQRLESCLREVDTVARLGGDEFVVMLEDLSEQPIEAATQTEAVGEKILAILNQPYQLDTHEYHSTASIGATIFSGHGQSGEELLKRADIAMYQAKKAGRNTLRFFDPQMQVSITGRFSLEGELRKALGNQEFQLYYQIQVDSSHRPLGAEALIRWIHPLRGMVSPAQFIPLAEETGLILPIGLWVLETACTQLKAWEQAALTRDLVLAVNVSAKQFHQADFVAQVQAAVQRLGINPMRLKLELTEGMLLENIEDTIATMNALKEIGVQFSLDDFGTGYSSLQYLKRLPLDQLKIDQSFVRDIATDSSDKAIVRTIIAMAHALNLGAIAEGVETEDQRQFLLGKGCMHFQG